MKYRIILSMFLGLGMYLPIDSACAQETDPSQPHDEHTNAELTKAENPFGKFGTIESLKKAAQEGNAQAQGILAQCYGRGVGVEIDYEQTAFWSEKAAKAGDVLGQSVLSICYLSGKGKPVDLKKGFEWGLKAAEQGNAHAQGNVGRCYAEGMGTPKDVGRAVEWLKKSAESGNAPGMAALANCYQIGFGVSQDIEKALKLYKQAVKNGALNPGQYYLYFNLLVETKSEDHQEIIDMVTMDASHGYPPAVRALGIILFEGRYGVDVQMEKGYEWAQKAADLGDSEAERMIAVLYSKGLVVEQDVDKYLEYMERSANHGNIQAMMDLSVDYDRGEILDEDTVKSVYWLSRACDNNYKEGQELYKEWQKKIPQIEQAADEGNAEGQYLAGGIYALGLGKDVDMDKARHYLQMAVEQEHELAEGLLQMIEENKDQKDQ